ncbi:hypothetical protein [uncultured Lactobacillus sp.]|uniref:hypothetical protein n=1 Tax=uncultured Lactobacillus sp. TaxID=153152 RepID=UPI00261C4E00|nr:hypothetical protein [uncultured Lactobacillus sp.]
MILKRAEPSVEKEALQIAGQYMDNVSSFKVYILLNSDGSHKLNTNGQVAMKMLSNEEIIEAVDSGKVFALPDGID